MPKLSVWMVRASLLHMGVGFLFGALLLAHKGVPFYDGAWRLLNPHIEVMIFGWTMQFVMGMAFWILPRFTGEGRYGAVHLGWWSFVLLNIGITATSIGSWFALPIGAVIGRLFSLGAVTLFMLMIWTRVKPLSDSAPASRKSI